jgi:hypothetical protein
MPHHLLHAEASQLHLSSLALTSPLGRYVSDEEDEDDYDDDEEQEEEDEEAPTEGKVFPTYVLGREVGSPDY